MCVVVLSFEVAVSVVEVAVSCDVVEGALLRSYRIVCVVMLSGGVSGDVGELVVGIRSEEIKMKRMTSARCVPPTQNTA